MKRLIPLVCVFLWGCSASKPLPAIQIEKPIPLMPKVLKQPCSAIQELPDSVTMGVLVQHYNDLVELYTVCRLHNQAKIDWADQHGL
ncbi:hypothetical protein GJ904_23095 [Salmonella enterica]|nr:hypothetical protein [Salmonella enterica subsp. enterica serovar Saintpaul]EEC1303948.1 hypothetical protein [Salmonella enterica]